ncbi:hypothetical protein BASA81_001158 [Batrachochytrium salamandrivorans]|nr:hypothetical protein BASA81_001158 [Batrachochytrium salamandrivorans]
MDSVGNSVLLEHRFVLGVSDFQHHRRALPASALIRYAAEARYVAFATWPALVRMLQEEEGGGGIEIRTQVVRFLRPTSSLLLPGFPITIKQSPHAIGTNNLTICCDFYEDNTEGEVVKDPFAQVFTLLVRVDLKDGSLLQLPAYINKEVVWQYPSREALQKATDQAWLYDLLFAKAKEVDPSKLPSKHQVLVRPSDLGGNRVTAARLAEYFEDALEFSGGSGGAVPDLLVVETLKSIPPGQECDVVFAVDDGNELLLLLLDKFTRQPLARSYVHWQYKLLT